MKKEEKTLSIIIPAFQVAFYLKQCLNSILAASSVLQDIEIWIIDDGSTDDTFELAEHYHAKNRNTVFVIHKENGGHGSAINMGIKVATGKYIRLIDGDDWVDTRNFIEYVKNLKNLTCDMVITPYTCVIGRREKQQRMHLQLDKRIVKGQEYPFSEIGRKSHICMHEVTFRTEKIKKMSGFLDEHCYYVDMEYILFPIPKIKTFCVLPYRVYQYRLGNNGQSVNILNMQKNILQYEKVMKRLFQFYTEQKEKKISKKKLNYIAVGLAKMETNWIQTELSFYPNRRHKKRIMQMEKWICKMYPLVYQKMEKKSVWLMRRCNYRFYLIASILVRRKTNIKREKKRLLERNVK